MGATIPGWTGEGGEADEQVFRGHELVAHGRGLLLGGVDHRDHGIGRHHCLAASGDVEARRLLLELEVKPRVRGLERRDVVADVAEDDGVGEVERRRVDAAEAGAQLVLFVEDVGAEALLQPDEIGLEPGERAADVVVCAAQPPCMVC